MFSNTRATSLVTKTGQFLFFKVKAPYITTMPGRPKRKAVDNTAQKAKKAKGETDLKWDLKWTTAGKPDKNGIEPLIALRSDTLDGCTKIVGFDIDWTVIKTASGRKFATGKRKLIVENGGI